MVATNWNNFGNTTFQHCKQLGESHLAVLARKADYMVSLHSHHTIQHIFFLQDYAINTVYRSLFGDDTSDTDISDTETDVRLARSLVFVRPPNPPINHPPVVPHSNLSTQRFE